MQTKNEFHYSLEVDVHDVDFNGNCRASSVLKYIQTAAQSQLSANGMSYDELIKMGYAFIISRMKLEILSPIKVYDKLTAISFPCESKGFSFIRCYKLLRGSETVARAYSVWALIDINTHRLVRVNDFDIKLPLGEALDIEMPHFRLPSEMEDAGVYTVTYADLDQNNHVNNTRYADIISNFLPLKARRIATITINYQNEARWNERLSVERYTDGERYYIRTVRSDGKINSEAEIILCDL